MILWERVSYPCSGGRHFVWDEAGKVVVVLAGNYAHGVGVLWRVMMTISMMLEM